MFRILHDTSYDFIRWWKQGLIIRIGFIVVGLIFLAVNKLHFSIEFTGGTLMQVQFTTPPGDAAIRAAVSEGGFPGAEITPFGSDVDYTIRAQLREGATAQSANDSTSALIARALQQRFAGTNAVKVVRAETVGPTVGAELRRNAAMAVLAAFIVTLVYLAFRFEWRFGLAAIVANAHEVFATFAFLAIMRLEFSPEVLAAILTVIGYSLNDTIIIFDRVRENLKKARKEPLRDVVNRSINETLPRSVLTHATVLAAALSLLFFAGPVLRPFSWIMAFGVFTATFTSIYIAGALLLGIEHRWPRTPVGVTKGAKASLAPGSKRGEQAAVS
jgi:preprotein translocase subunit SecF